MINLSVRLAAACVLVVLTVGIALGLGWQKWHKPSGAAADQDLVPEEPATPKVLYWYDPMVPNQHFDKPGPSPFMDMDLVPKYAEPEQDVPGLTIPAEVTQNLGMRIGKVQRGSLGSQLDVTGTLQFSERNQTMLQLRAAGFAEKVWPLAVGDRVEVGQAIAQLHFPEWLDAQNELLSQPANDSKKLLQTLRLRLKLLGMPDALIAKIEKTRQPDTQMTFVAPVSGVITELGIKTGMTLASGATLASIYSLDHLWLDAAIPEAQAMNFRTGDRASFFPADHNAQPLTGKLEYFLPVVDKASRTLTARIVLNNPAGKLLPGTSGRVRLSSANSPQGLLIPAEAVIRTGKRELVMLAEGEGRFRPVEVTAGSEYGDQIHIIEGLTEGQEIVLSGQFLLDSEATLMGVPLQPLSHDGMEMDHD